MNNLEAALHYATMGLRLFPLHADKRPRTRNGFKDATLSHGDIKAWWNKWPEAPIGLATGDRLGENRYLFVLDIDVKHGQRGDEELAELEALHGELPDTPVVHTASGGRHIYMTSPSPISNQYGSLPQDGGIDIRGKGGYVILPPSRCTYDETGTLGPYTNDTEHALGEIRIAEAPQWLLDVLKRTDDDDDPRPVAAALKPKDVYDELDDRPGTEWAESVTWESLLVPDGWTFVQVGGDGEDQWARPGQTVPDKVGATTNFGGADRLVVHSTNAPIPADSYSKLGYLAETRFGGDFSAAARSVKSPDQTADAWLADSAPKKAEAVEYVAADVDDDWPEPLALGLYSNRPVDFPLRAFPDWIKRQVLQAAEEMQLTADLPAQLALGALSTIFGGRVDVAVDQSWHEPVNLYLVTALPPGAGKSPVFGFMIEKPLGDLERMLDEEGARDRALAGHMKKAAEKELDKAINSGSQDEIRSAHDKLETLEVKPPPKIFVDDITIEQLAVQMRDQGGKMALVSTEGGVFQQLTGRYSDKTNLDPYLMAWSGDTMRVDRVGREEVRVYDPALTVAVTVQPTVLRALASAPELAGRGLTARFMYSIPVDTVGHRDFMRESTYQPGIAAEYSETLVSLARTARQHYTESKYEVRLTKEGERFVKAIKAAHEEELTEGGSLHGMREWVTKAQSSLVRVAGLLHMADQTGEMHIPIETVERAALIMDYWIAHARRAHDLFNPDTETSVSRLLLDFLAAHVEPGGEFTIRDITQWSRTGPFAKKAAAIEPLELLVDTDWVRPLFSGPITTGRGRPSPTFQLSPYVVNLRGVETDVGRVETYREAQPTVTADTSVTGSSEPTTQVAEVETVSLMSLDTHRTKSLSISVDNREETGTRTQTPTHEAHSAQPPETVTPATEEEQDPDPYTDTDTEPPVTDNKRAFPL